MKNKTYNTELLFDYMKIRSKVEKQKWELSKDYLEGFYDKGVRDFFGVQLSDGGFILTDNQQPYNGFLLKTMKELCVGYK